MKNTAQNGYQTVLITKGGKSDPVTADNIVYVDQAAANQNFQTATKFLLKYNSDDNKSVKDGLYTIRFGGGEDGQIMAREFAVGIGIDGYDTELTALEGGAVASEDSTTYRLSFVTSNGGVQLTNGAVILVKIGDQVMAYPVDSNIHISGNVTAVLGVQIDEIPTKQRDSVKVYLRQGGSVERQTQASNESVGE